MGSRARLSAERVCDGQALAGALSLPQVSPLTRPKLSAGHSHVQHTRSSPISQLPAVG